MDSQSNVFVQHAKNKENVTSKRSRIIACILSFFVPIGAHNYYLGYHIKGIVQSFMVLGFVLFVPLPILVIILPFYFAWITSEGLYFLLYDDVKDGDGFPLNKRNISSRVKTKNAILMAFFVPFGIHYIYLGKLKLGFIVWGYTAVIVSTNILFQIIPLIYIIWISILIAVVVSWIDGFRMVLMNR